MDKQEKYAILVAGGSGTRMSSSIPKQFIAVGEKPILMHTLEAFYECDASIRLVVVLPKAEQVYWKDLLTKHAFDIPHEVVDGGHSRFSSVRNGLSVIPESSLGLVAIHDGVRPFVSTKVINQSFAIAGKLGNGIAAVALKESIRKIDGETNEHVPRSGYQLIQTPQTFNIAQIKKAFEQEEKEDFTDDASVLEADGGIVHLFEGDYRNIKVTTPDDLLWAEAFLAQSRH